ncbi:MAG: MFS transporter [Alphaproteobacteria bacterium]|nr:MFS transporter [Alphaproteobacteria bacterium]
MHANEAATPAAIAPHAPDVQPRRRAVRAFAGLLLAVVPATLDMQIAATALPAILAEFGGMEQVAWVAAGFLLASAVAMPLAGRLGDRWGRRQVFAGAVALFVLGSLACGLAGSMAQLVVARALQGAGGGAIIVSLFAGIADLFAARERARFQGYAAGAFALSSMIAPTLGGLITDLAGWRWVFLVNLPFALPAPFLAAALPGARAGKPVRLDVTGAVLLGAGLTALVVLSERGAAGAGPAATVPWLAAAAALLVLWIAASLRAAAPVVPLHLLRERVIGAAVAVAFVSGWATFGLVQYLVLFLQAVLGASATAAGLVMMASTVSITVSSMASSMLVARTGRMRWIPPAALAICLVAMALLATMGAATGFATVALNLALLGVGSGLTLQLMVLAVQEAAPAEELGAATAMVTVARLVGATVGVAVFGFVLNACLPPAPDAAAMAAALSRVFLSALPVLACGLAAALAFRPAPLARQ